MKFSLSRYFPKLSLFVGQGVDRPSKQKQVLKSTFDTTVTKSSLAADQRYLASPPKNKDFKAETVFSVGPPPSYALFMRPKAPACTWSMLHTWCENLDVSEGERSDRRQMEFRIRELGQSSLRALYHPLAALEGFLLGRHTIGTLGSLNLDGLDHLTSLPPGLCFGGSLSLRNCFSLRTLPRDLRVEGNLDLTGCRALEEIAPGLVILGSLYLDRCTCLTGLPDEISVGKSLSLAGCSALERLPAQLHVNGNLNLSGCENLGKISTHLTVEGDLDLMECPSLTALDADLRVSGSVYLSGCSSLSEVLGSLKIDRNLQMSDCIGLKSFRAFVSVGETLDLGGCRALLHLPDSLSVAGDLILTECEALPRLPESLRVNGNLTMLRCSQITQLPEALEVGGRLDASLCAQLQRLGKNTRIGGDLIAQSCSSLIDLGRDLTLAGTVRLDDCSGLARFPEALLTLGPLANGHLRDVFLRRTALPAEVAQRLRQAPPPGLRLHLDLLSDIAAQRPFATLTVAIAFWRDLLGKTTNDERLRQPGLFADAVAQNLDAAQSDALRLFLGRLRGTADFRNDKTLPLLADRVEGLLRALRDEPDLGAVCCDRLGEALVTCGDRIMLALNEVEIMILVKATIRTAADEKPLEQLGLALWRRDLVQREARQKCLSLPRVDEVEVYLAYEIGLREQLRLPSSTRTMLYPRIAEVTEDDLRRAQHNISTTLADSVARKEYLDDWAPLQDYLRERAVRAWRFDEVPPAQLPPNSSPKNLFCTITQKTFVEIKEPLFYIRGTVCVVYEATELVTWWRLMGTDPNTRQKVALTDYRRASQETPG